MQDIYKTFEFHKIRESLTELAKTEVAREQFLSLVALPNIESVEAELKDLSEMMSLITRFGPLPIATSASAIKMIEMAKKTALLSPRDLNLIAEDVLTSQNVAKFLNKVGVGYDRINNIIKDFFDLTNLEKEIHRVITNALTIADNATANLKEIRGKLRKAENELQQKVASLSFTYSSYLNDSNATIRDGHFVLPVKTADKSKVLGIVYDISDTGSTTFIEPMEIVQINNLITSLKVEENEECRKILKQLTALVLLQENEILTNNKIIAHLDFLSAKSLYAANINGEIAEISHEQIVELDSARHPLIDGNKVISNSYRIDEDKRIVIISGPNAGGKTVSLKTVGLLVLMNQCGLALPVRKATLGYFKHIYIDIGDNQSLSDNLSTFSAHMSHISEIVDLAKGHDLILLDELGTGTDPREGEALALSVTKYLENTHCLAMISSHFDALKEYAFLSKNIENSSMIFDEEKLLPTYRFRLGAPGHSYALDVATRYGIKDSIIEGAKKYLKENAQNDASELLLILQKKVEETTKLEDELLRQKKLVEEKEKKIANDEKLLSEKRQNLLKDVNEEKENLIAHAKEEIDNILSSLNKDGLKMHEVIASKHKLEDLKTYQEQTLFNEEIQVDDYVSVPSLGINGTVKRIQGNKAYINGENGFSFNVAINELHKINKPTAQNKKKPEAHHYNQLFTSVPLELNLIGKHVEEAEMALTKYVDSCRLRNYPTARIIHGFGSGALRKMVEAYLDKENLKHRRGDEHEGGGGATIIIFHDK